MSSQDPSSRQMRSWHWEEALHWTSGHVTGMLIIEHAAEVGEGVPLPGRDEHDAATLAAVPTIRTAERDELLPPEGDATVSPVTADHMDGGFVDEGWGESDGSR